MTRLPLKSSYGAGPPGARSAGGGDTQDEAGVRSGAGSSSGIIVADASRFVALAGVALARCAVEACDIAGWPAWAFSRE